MSAFEQLKEEIVKVCGVISWKPTDKQLLEIAKKLSELNSPSVNDVHAVVGSVCPDETYLCLEGIDNSEVQTLLAIAIRVAKSKG